MLFPSLETEWSMILGSGDLANSLLLSIIMLSFICSPVSGLNSVLRNNLLLLLSNFRISSSLYNCSIEIVLNVLNAGTGITSEKILFPHVLNLLSMDVTSFIIEGLSLSKRQIILFLCFTIGLL